MVLNFLLNSEKFGLNISDVLEVNKLSEVFPVHGAGDYIAGLINFHGKSVPVVALDRLLMLSSGRKEKDLFVAVKTKNGPLCFSVDELIGFDEVPETKIRNTKDLAFKFDSSYLQFVYLNSNSMISVLDVNFLTGF